MAYKSRGLDDWTYAFVDNGVGEVSDFDLTMTTDFVKVDFPPGSMSPTAKRPTERRMGASKWKFGNLVTGQHIGIDLPNRINPGPLAARLTAFAPVSLLFFLTVMVILGVLSGQNLHPVNYGFLSAAFFAFHLLLAYLVDHISIHAAFLDRLAGQRLPGGVVPARRRRHPLRASRGRAWRSSSSSCCSAMRSSSRATRG